MSAPHSRTHAESIRFTVLSLNLAALVFLCALPVFAVKAGGGSARLSGVLLSLLGAGLLHGLGRLLRIESEHGDAFARLSDRLTQGFHDLAQAVEKTSPATPAVDETLVRITEIRLAIRQSRWDDAGQLLRDFETVYPDHPDSPRLAKELDHARASARQELLSKIAAAREVNDPERVIELREALRDVVESEHLRTIDRDLAKWFMTLIHKRLRTGTVREDVAVLASRVAVSLDGTPEGASLRASLPTLRRAAGLCPRCGQPYKGVADACPTCLTGATGSPGFSVADDPGEPEDDLESVKTDDEFGMGQLGD